MDTTFGARPKCSSMALLTFSSFIGMTSLMKTSPPVLAAMLSASSLEKVLSPAPELPSGPPPIT